MIRPATIFVVLGIAVLVGLGLILVYLAWQVLTWILVAVILACALNPAVEALERRGLARGVCGRRRLHPRALGDDRGRIPDRPAAHRPGVRVHRGGPGLRGRPHAGTGSARLAPGRLPDRRSHPRGDRGPGSGWGSRAQSAGTRHRAERGDCCRRRDHDYVPDVLHAPRRPADDPGSPRPACPAIARALRAGRLRHLQDDQRLRHRQSPDQPRRRSYLGGGALRRRAASSRSLSDCSSGSSTSSPSRGRRWPRSSSRRSFFSRPTGSARSS